MVCILSAWSAAGGVGTTRSLRLPPTPKPSVISGGLCQRHPTTHRLSPAPGCSDISWLPWLQTVPIATAESRDLITPPAQRRGHRQRRGAASPEHGPGPLPAALRRLPLPSQRDPTPPPTPSPKASPSPQGPSSCGSHRAEGSGPCRLREACGICRSAQPATFHLRRRRLNAARAGAPPPFNPPPTAAARGQNKSECGKGAWLRCECGLSDVKCRGGV